MPELPEVEHLRRTLHTLLAGRRVASVRLLRPDICPAQGGRAPTPDALLLHGEFIRPRRRGKQLALLVADGRALRVRLGMTGQLVVVGPGRAAPRQDHVHARWTLDDGSTLLFRDPRRFGRLAPSPSRDELRRAWAPLGPDALAIAGDRLASALARTTRAVKAALLDQSLLAGVGNIYADESLFRARIDPRRRADRLDRPEAQRLARAIRAVLTTAIAHGGSTLRDYVDARGVAGSHQLAHRVYGRAGLPCLRCGATLQNTRISQRSTVFCPLCQARPDRSGPGRFPHSRAARPGPDPTLRAALRPPRTGIERLTDSTGVESRSSSTGVCGIVDNFGGRMQRICL